MEDGLGNNLHTKAFDSCLSGFWGPHWGSAPGSHWGTCPPVPTLTSEPGYATE